MLSCGSAIIICWPQRRPASVEKLARIGWHEFRFFRAATRAGDDGLISRQEVCILEQLQDQGTFPMRAVTFSQGEKLAIGEFSKRSRVNIETIRYYERIKMLPAPSRTASGRRIYREADLRILVFIRRARELGFHLKDIRALLRLGARPTFPCAEASELAARHLQDIRAKLRDLKKLERLLAEAVARCPGGTITSDECPILSLVDIQRSGFHQSGSLSRQRHGP
jgi:MerR family mercuric resistance operon transcriptional regulator